MSNSRLVWLDNLKAFAIFFLFYGHLCGCFSDSFNLFAVTWHMPLFVFAFGFTSYGLYQRINNLKDVDCYFRKLSVRIGIPNLLFTTILMTMVYAFDSRWHRVGIMAGILAIGLIYAYVIYKDLLPKRITAISLYFVLLACFVNRPIWFLPFYIEMMMIFAISKVLSMKISKALSIKRDSLALFSIIFVVACYITPSEFSATAEFCGIFLLAFFTNIYSSKICNTIKAIGNIRVFAYSLLMFGIGCLCHHYYASISHQFYLSSLFSLLNEHDFSTYPLRQCAIVFLVVPIVFSVIHLTQIGRGKYTSFSRCGALTMPLYAINLIMALLNERWMHTYEYYATNNSYWTVVVIYALISLVVSIILANALNRSAYTRFAFLGVTRL